MLQKENRLKKNGAFIATYKSGNSRHKGGITMFCGRENQHIKPTKFGFVVSKKIHKRAVKRNRIKRLMRESIRLHIKGEKIQNRYMSVIFVASARLLDKNFSEINHTMSKLVENL